MNTLLADTEAYVQDLVAAGFTTANDDHQAARNPLELTISALGGCTRAAAYKLAGTPPSDEPAPEEARQAMLGTWLHEGLLPAMAWVAGADAVLEEKVRIRAAGLDLPGRLDLQIGRVLLDLKTTREYQLHAVRRTGRARRAHLVQGFGYALGRIQAGHPVDTVVIVYLDRSSGDVEVVAETVTNGAVLAVIDRIATLRRLAELDPDVAPREERGPGLSFACDRCPWLRRCWGPDAVPGQAGPQRRLADTPDGIEHALALYAEVAGLEAAPRARETDKQFARMILDMIPDGDYGDWRLKRRAPRRMLDQPRARQLLAELGQQIPEIVTAPSMSVSPRKKVPA